VSGRSSRSTPEPENLAGRLMVSSVRKMSRRATGVPMNTLASVLNRSALQHLTHDGVLLFVTRFVRLFSYGALSVVLVFYLTGLGLSESQTGILLTLTLLGDTLVSLFLTTQADRIGQRRTLIIGAILMAGAGLIFHNFLFLVVAGTIGVISPSGNEVGPFLSIEQAALSQVIPSRERTAVFAWYTLIGAIATGRGLPVCRVALSKAPAGRGDACRERTGSHPRLCSSGTPPHVAFQPPLVRCRSTSRCRRQHHRQELAWHRVFPRYCPQAIGPVCSRRVWGRLTAATSLTPTVSRSWRVARRAPIGEVRPRSPAPSTTALCSISSALSCFRVEGPCLMVAFRILQTTGN
jgi:hypothetical protein